MMTDVIDHTNDTHYETDKATGEMKPVNETVRPDPQPDVAGPDNLVPAQGVVPEHREDEIEGVIQYKDHPDGAIHEKLPDEQDLAEGKITPAAVPKYDRGVTQEDVDLGKVSPTAVRLNPAGSADANGVPHAFDDKDMEDLITVARNKTSLSRLNHNEALQVFRTLEAEGYVVSKT